MKLLGALVAALVGELFVVVQVARMIGATATLLVLLAFSALGAWIVKHEGIETGRRINQGLRAGRIPAAGLVDAFLVMFAGMLLLIPGFLSDLLGLLMLVRPIRSRLGSMTMRMIERRVSRRIRIVGNRLGPDSPFGARFTPPFDGRSGGGFDHGSWTDDAERPTDGGPDLSDVIDLEAEEYFLNDPVGELDPPMRDDLRP